MAAAASPNAARSRRARGVKAGIDLAMILRVARSIDPETLTMQAVADELGVDRKAVNHHVSDRGALLQLVAMDAFTANFTAVRIPAGADWRTACRIFAFGLADSTIAAGPFAGHFQLSNAIKGTVLESVDAVMRTFVEAGFDVETAMRSLALLADIAVTYGRDMTTASEGGENNRHVWLRAALEERHTEDFPYAARMVASSINTYDRKQLEHSVEVFLRGTETLRES
jgi:TetR/AcrR family tetracycline transcriptional repressor